MDTNQVSEALAAQPNEAGSLADALVNEVNHRAANSLQLALSLLQRQAALTLSPLARRDLMIAASQLSSIALVHRRLYQTQSADLVDLPSYLRDLVCEISAAINRPSQSGMVWDSTCPKLLVPSVTATRLGLIVTELLTNCAKHAGVGCSCCVSLSSEREEIELKITDNGPGLPVGFPRMKCESAGMRLIETLCSSLGGTLTVPKSATGACFIINVPQPVQAWKENTADQSEDTPLSCLNDMTETDQMLLAAFHLPG